MLVNFLLCIIAVVLFLPLYLLNMIVVMCKGGELSGFFRSTALSIDHYANYEFRTLFNLCLIKGNAIKKFGSFDEPISYVLALNQKAKTLTACGIALCYIIERLDKGHFEKTVMEIRK